MPANKCDRCGDLGTQQIFVWVDRKFGMPRGRQEEYDEEFELCSVHLEAAMQSIVTDRTFIRDLLQRRKNGR